MELLKTLAENKELGFGILILIAVAILVKVFLNHIRVENKLSRETHKEISQNSMEVVKEATSVIRNLHDSARLDHNDLKNKQNVILEKVSKTEQEVSSIKYKLEK